MAESAALDMSADPDKFDEACGDFAARRVVSRAEADALSGYARKRAWWISGVAQLDVVNDAHRSLLAAISDGTTFEDWKKAIGPKLEAAWGRANSPRILTIFRNATTSAYNAGRWQQMTQPHVKALRPYVEYDVVDDTRTSRICKPLRGVVLPIDDTFVLTHNPPLHHMCRTGLVSQRRSVAESKGITEQRPDIKVTPGFGLPPQFTEPPKLTERAEQPAPELVVEGSRKAAGDLQRPPVTLPKKAIREPLPVTPIDFGALPKEKIPGDIAFPGADHDLLTKEDFETAKRFTKDSGAQARRDLTKAEVSALKDFVDVRYGDIRLAAKSTAAEYALKEGTELSYKQAKAKLANINSALEKVASLPVSSRVESKVEEVYRGLGGLSKTSFDELINSNEVVWDAPTSTSWHAGAAQAFYRDKDYSVFYRIKPSAKTKMASVEGFSGMSDEKELVWGNGVKFRQVKVVRDDSRENGAIVYLEEVD